MAIALQLLGAAAGISALSSAVGGAMLWLRLHALNLPGDESVSVLPKGLLLTVGLHASRSRRRDNRAGGDSASWQGSRSSRRRSS
jgi:hypothetical protein